MYTAKNGKKEKPPAGKDIYLRPGAAAKKLKAALELGNVAYLYGVTGIGKTTLVQDMFARRPYEYYSATKTEPEQIPVRSKAPEPPQTELQGKAPEPPQAELQGKAPEPPQAELRGKELELNQAGLRIKDPESDQDEQRGKEPDQEELWSRAKTAAEADAKERGTERIVVIDDLHSVTLQAYQDRYALLIQNLLEQDNIRLILISRAPVPGWLLPLHVKYRFLEIEEKDFYFSRKDQDDYLEQCGIRLSKEESEKAWSLGKGHPVSLKILVLANGNIQLAVKNMWRWLEHHVFDRWEIELQEFLMETSIVEDYTKEMAQMITGRDNVDELIARAEELGSFLTRTGENGIWKYRWGMRQPMRERLMKKYSQGKIKSLYSHAGLCYEMYGRYREALEMYEICGDKEGIRRVLSANARRNPAAGAYFELRNYYLALPEKTVLQDPVLIAYMSMLQSILMDEEESERWYRCLKEYIRSHSGSEKREAKARLIYLDIALPHRGSADLISLIKCAGNLVAGQMTALPEFSVTTNLPSLMNGGKDFCEWSKRDRELAGSIGKVTGLVLGKYGKGLVPLALAESSLEKGEESFEVIRLAEKGRMCAESGGKTELCFVAAALMVWVSLLNGAAEYAEETAAGFREKAKQEAPRMLPNVDALLCRIYLYQRRPLEVEQWMTEAPRETEEFCTLERFRYLTKVRVYLQSGRYEAALALLQQLLCYAEKMKRTYIQMEASLLLAIAMYRVGHDEWREVLQKCVTKAEDYHFVRLFSREGGVVLELLETGGIVWKDVAFKTQVLEECRRMAKFYPGYLSQGADREILLSPQATRILRLQAEGISIKEIANRLDITVDTVKYHNKETYRKLGVNSRAEAVNEAKKRKLI